MRNVDWDKHVSDRPEVHRLPVLEFGGRYFIEKCLTFEEANTPTIYHLPVSLLHDWAEIRSGLDDWLVIMQLGDNCACSKKGSAVLRKYREEYRRLAKRLRP